MSHRIYVSTAGFKHLRELPVVLERFADARIQYVELSGGLEHYHGPLVNLLNQWSKSAGFRYIVHNYFPVPQKPFLLNIASTDETAWEQSIDFCKDSLHMSAEIEAPLYGIHAGYAGKLRDRGDGYFFPEEDGPSKDWDHERVRSYQQLLKAMDQLAPLADQLGTRLCIENLYPMHGLPPQLMINVKDWRQFLKDTEGSGVGFLIDLAHLKISEKFGKEDFDSALNWVLNEGREAIYQLHISETDGSWDSHALLSEDSWLFSCLRAWSIKTGWPDIPVSYESRHFSIDHLDMILPLIQSSFLNRSEESS